MKIKASELKQIIAEEEISNKSDSGQLPIMK